LRGAVIAEALDGKFRYGMLRGMLCRSIRGSLALTVSALSIVACAKSGSTSADPGSMQGGSGSSSGSGAGADATTPGDSVPGGDDSGGGPLTVPDSGNSGDACQHLDVTFAPKIPLVFVLADRSGSIFAQMPVDGGGTSDEWTPLRTATLAVIQSLQAQVAFGFGAYTGINPNTTPNMCPIFDSVPIALNNYSPIQTLYSALGQPMFKAETPGQKSLDRAAQLLVQAAAAQADAGAGGQPGGKYILYVTDGETDFCDDGNPVCPADAVTAEIEKLSMQGIQTLILGVGSNLSNISVPVLQGFANAGAGLPALAPPGSAQGAPLSPTDIYNQCNSVTGWNQLFMAAGLQAGQALGTYAAAGAPVTNATVYSPESTNVVDLTSKISSALMTVKSCSFDLQGKIKVDLPNAGKGHVSIDGTSVPYDATNGWTMASPTQLDLVGTSCQAWRTSGKDISFDFPCEIIIMIAK
jgi:hypothetical protein